MTTLLKGFQSGSNFGINVKKPCAVFHVGGNAVVDAFLTSAGIHVAKSTRMVCPSSPFEDEEWKGACKELQLQMNILQAQIQMMNKRENIDSNNDVICEDATPNTLTRDDADSLYVSKDIMRAYPTLNQVQGSFVKTKTMVDMERVLNNKIDALQNAMKENGRYTAFLETRINELENFRTGS